jgi:hypothetical protein
MQVLPTAERPGAIAWYPTGRPNPINTGTIATTIALASNGVTLPAPTIFVASVVGFPTSGTVTIGLDTVKYTGLTQVPPALTGVTGGTHTLSTGEPVVFVFVDYIFYFDGPTWTWKPFGSGNGDVCDLNNVGAGTHLIPLSIDSPQPPIVSAFPNFKIKSIAAGSNVTIDDSTNTMVISSSGGGGGNANLTPTDLINISIVSDPGTISNGPNMTVKTFTQAPSNPPNPQTWYPGNGIFIDNSSPGKLTLENTLILQSAGGAFSLVQNPQNLSLKGLAGSTNTNGSGITIPLSGDTTYYTINAVLPQLAYQGSSIDTLVLNGDPTLGDYSIRGLVAGSGISVATVGNDVQITNTIPQGAAYYSITIPVTTQGNSNSTFCKIDYILNGPPVANPFTIVYFDYAFGGNQTQFSIQPAAGLLSQGFGYLSIDFETIASNSATNRSVWITLFDSTVTTSQQIYLPQVSVWPANANQTVQSGQTTFIPNPYVPLNSNFGNIVFRLLNASPPYIQYALPCTNSAINMRVNMQF